MVKNYSLRLISNNKPDTPSGICSSNQMIAWGLWSEFSKHPHVTLSYYNDSQGQGGWASGEQSFNELPEVDFTLIHTYAPVTIFTEAKKKTKHEVMWLSELPYTGMDHNFTFLPSTWSEQVPLPILRDLIEEYTIAEKTPGSILLDHSIPRQFANYANWSGRLLEWLAPTHVARQVCQQRRVEWESDEDRNIPEWVSSLFPVPYPKFLKATASFETFIMTHPGTYEHQIIDMVARGIRVLVPVEGGLPFAPQDTINRLGLETFATREGLLSLLNSPASKPPFSFDSCTSMPEMVATVDQHCQQCLKGD
jgi:hypothetical protein